MDCPFDSAFGIPDGPKLQGDGGNVLLDRILGVELRVATDATWEDLWLQAERLAQEYERKGHKVYRMPTGGSTPLGALAFVQAGLEVAPEKFDWIVTASSSGSTQAGLTYAFHGSPTRVVGIACDPEEDLYEDMARLCAGLDELTKQSKFLAAGDFDLRFDWVGPGYGVVTDNGMEAIKMLARTEGIFLDPVYSSKSFAALLDLIQ